MSLWMTFKTSDRDTVAISGPPACRCALCTAAGICHIHACKFRHHDEAHVPAGAHRSMTFECLL